MEILDEPWLERDFKDWYYGVLLKKRIAWTIILTPVIFAALYLLLFAIDVGMSLRATYPTQTWVMVILAFFLVGSISLAFRLSFIVSNKVHGNAIIKGFEEHYQHHEYKTPGEIESLRSRQQLPSDVLDNPLITRTQYDLLRYKLMLKLNSLPSEHEKYF